MSSLYKEKSIRIHALVHVILQYLENECGRAYGIDRVLKKMQGMDLSLQAIIDAKPCDTRHAPILTEAIENINTPQLRGIANCLKQARHDLVWREDNAQFYTPQSDVGDGYRNCNLHSMLVGPDACGFHTKDFSLGLFMLCLLYTSPSPRDLSTSRMPSSA